MTNDELLGKRIVLGVTGGIAAYKAIEVCRRLVDAGAHVSPVMTSGAKRFVGEATFNALASEKVQTSLWSEASPIPHTVLGQQADLIIVCPATARLLSDYRTGRSAGLLTATLLATRAPVLLAPAMHTEMWEHPSVQENLSVLSERGVHIVPPEEGRLAGGDIGKGRLASPETVVAAAAALLGPTAKPTEDFAGCHVVVSAGGTREPIDPVRYIANRSSGKQGIAIATDALRRGATVTLVSTVPAELGANGTVVPVETAAQMHAAVTSAAKTADVVVMAAAVADFRPDDASAVKLKKRDGIPQVHLVETIDILAELGANKPVGQVVVGFAAETTDLRTNAEAKLAKKGADLIIANDVSAPMVGFGHDTNAVVILGADGFVKEIPLTTKPEVACAVLDAVRSILDQHRSKESM